MKKPWDRMTHEEHALYQYRKHLESRISEALERARAMCCPRQEEEIEEVFRDLQVAFERLIDHYML